MQAKQLSKIVEYLFWNEFGDPNKFCVKWNKALPIGQDLEQGKI